jgi:glutamate synthase (NADPH/NADH) small chain
MENSGVTFHANVTVGEAGTPLSDLQSNFDAVLLAVGSTIPRLINVEGAQLSGIYPAMTYLEASNRAVRDDVETTINAKGLNVIILGGGDTGADCLGTLHRQGAASVVQIEILDEPPITRAPSEPWPTMARLLKSTSAHLEGGERLFSTETLEFRGQRGLEELVLRDNASGALVHTPADMVLIAAGFVGPELDDLGLNSEPYLTARGTLSVDDEWRISTSSEASPVFACGDAVRGQSLIVWAIAEGRSAARAIDGFLRGEPSILPAPVSPYELSW